MRRMVRETAGRVFAQADSGARPRTAWTLRLIRHRLPVMAGTAAVLTLLGPFGTYQDLALGGRLAYWGGLIVVGTLTYELAVFVALRLLKDPARRWRPMLAGVTLGVAMVMTLCVAVLERVARGNDLLTPLGLAELFLDVLVVTLLVSAVPVWLELRDRGLLVSEPPPAAATPLDAPPPGAAPASVETAPRADPPFLDRIPARLGRDLLALEMEDHYVRVHTALGSDLILMRLRDAVAELAGVEGMRVHRSHWVADAAVVEVERKPDGKLALRLRDGRRVPVSRTHAAAVRAAEARWTAAARPDNG